MMRKLFPLLFLAAMAAVTPGAHAEDVDEITMQLMENDDVNDLMSRIELPRPAGAERARGAPGAAGHAPDGKRVRTESMRREMRELRERRNEQQQLRRGMEAVERLRQGMGDPPGTGDPPSMPDPGMSRR